MKPIILAIALLFSSIGAIAIAKPQNAQATIQEQPAKNCLDCGLTATFIPPVPQYLAQSASNSTISVKTVYYPIKGSTAAQLRQQMNQLGPIDGNENRRFDARTNWYVRWSYRYANTSRGCAITSANVSTEIVFTLPQWQASANASPSLVRQWNRYLNALQVHENGHKDQGIAAGKEILRTLNNLPVSPCSAIETTANSAAQKIIKKYNQQDINYDRVTQHGFTQGANFP